MVSKPELWQRIESIAFDAPGASFPFTRRLARDNGWRTDFAQRVIEEYRRFAYLAVAMGREMTPSDEVDQAWHLHLTYTRHYWGAFREALGTDLHHGPTAGGDSERRRYRSNYADTLSAYFAEFGEEPPTDIWPPEKIRFGNAPHMRRINTGDYVLVPKWFVARPLAAVFALAVVFISTGTAMAADGATITKLKEFFFSLKGVVVAGGALVVVILAVMLARGGGKGGPNGCGGGVAGGGDSGCGGGGGCGGCGGG